MLKHLLALCSLLFCVPAAAKAPSKPPPAAAAPTVAVLPLVAPDLGAADRDALEESLRALLREGGVSVQDAKETRQNITSARDVGVACSFEALACQARMGLLTAVDLVIVARLTQEWDRDLLQVRLLDVLEGRAVRQTEQALPRDPAFRDVVLRGAVLRVVAPEQTGGLALAQVPADKGVWLDGVEVAPALLGDPISGLSPGAHVVELRAGEEVVRTLRLDVVAGVVTPVSFEGDSEAPLPEELSMAPFLATGGAVVAVSALLGAGALAAALEQPIEHDTRQAVRLSGRALLGVSAVGALVGAAGVGLWALEEQP